MIARFLPSMAPRRVDKHDVRRNAPAKSSGVADVADQYERDINIFSDHLLKVVGTRVNDVKIIKKQYDDMVEQAKQEATKNGIHYSNWYVWASKNKVELTEALTEAKERLEETKHQDLAIDKKLFDKALESAGNLKTNKTNSEEYEIFKKIKEESSDYYNSGYRAHNVDGNAYVGFVYYKARDLLNQILNVGSKEEEREKRNISGGSKKIKTKRRRPTKRRPTKRRR